MKATVAVMSTVWIIEVIFRLLFLEKWPVWIKAFWGVKIGLHAEPSTKDSSVQSSDTKLACFACLISPHQLYPLQVKAKLYRNSPTMCWSCQENCYNLRKPIEDHSNMWIVLKSDYCLYCLCYIFIHVPPLFSLVLTESSWSDCFSAKSQWNKWVRKIKCIKKK